MPNPIHPKILAIKPVQKGNLQAFASVQIGPLTLHDFRIIQQPGQRAYVSVPQRSYQKPDGSTGYSPILEMPDEWKQTIQNAVLAEWGDSE